MGCTHLCTLPEKIKVVPMATTTCYVCNIRYWRGWGFVRGEPFLAPVPWGPCLLPLRGQAGVHLHPCLTPTLLFLMSTVSPLKHAKISPVLETPNTQGKQTSWFKKTCRDCNRAHDNLGIFLAEGTVLPDCQLFPRLGKYIYLPQIYLSFNLSY